MKKYLKIILGVSLLFSFPAQAKEEAAPKTGVAAAKPPAAKLIVAEKFKPFVNDAQTLLQNCMPTTLTKKTMEERWKVDTQCRKRIDSYIETANIGLGAAQVASSLNGLLPGTVAADSEMMRPEVVYGAVRTYFDRLISAAQQKEVKKRNAAFDGVYRDALAQLTQESGKVDFNQGAGPELKQLLDAFKSKIQMYRESVKSLTPEEMTLLSDYLTQFKNKILPQG